MQKTNFPDWQTATFDFVCREQDSSTPVLELEKVYKLMNVHLVKSYMYTGIWNKLIQNVIKSKKKILHVKVKCVVLVQA
jgi:hypothetical protein